MDEKAGSPEKYLTVSEMREKDWNELDVLERLERMRQIVKMNAREIQSLNEQLARLLDHQHNTQGEIVIRLHRTLGMLGSSKGRDSDKYF